MPPFRTGGPRHRLGRPGTLSVVTVAAVLALTLSAVLASRSGETHRSGGNCPVQALTCRPGQFDTVDRPGGTPSGDGRDGDTAGDAKAPALSATATSSAMSAVTPAGTSAATSAVTVPGPRPPSASTAVPCASYRACGFPDERVTGPRLRLTTRKSGPTTIRSDNQVIRGWDLHGSLDIYADNVTVIDSRITSDNWWGVNLRPGHHGLRVLHTTITAVAGRGPDNGGVDYAVANMSGSPVEVGWCDVSVFGNALSVGQGDLHDNYVHDIVPFINQSGQYQHTDAVISDGGGAGQLTVRHNTLLNPTPVDKGASASVGLFADTAPVSHALVEDNWLAGGAYALYGGGADATYIRVTGNVFSSQYHPNCGAYGPVAAWNAAGAGNLWRDNRTQDGQPVVPGPS